MEGEINTDMSINNTDMATNNTDMAKTDIPVTDVKAKQLHTPEDGHDGEGNSESDSWLVQVHKRYNSGHYEKRKPSYDASIYRVPESIRSSNPKAYDPLLVPLGPYHQKQHLCGSAMEDHKLGAVEKTLKRRPHSKKEYSKLSAMDDYKLQAVASTLDFLSGMPLCKLISEVSKLEQDIRACYEDSAIEWDRETLFLMLTMDACFILEFFRNYDMRDSIKRREMLLDILKLENQIPFCILIKIIELGHKKEGDADTLCTLRQAQKFLAGLLMYNRYFTGFPFKHSSAERAGGENKIEDLIINKSPCHLLDLCRLVISDFLTDSDVSGSDSDGIAENSIFTVEWGGASSAAKAKGIFYSLDPPTQHDQGSIPSANRLHKSGIEFRPSVDGKVRFKRKYFRRGTVFLPQITVDNSTEFFLRNLMAFEECHRRRLQSPTEISRHMCLVDKLIDSKKDVRLLLKQNIIRNYMGNDEVAALFDCLCNGITREDGGFKDVVKSVMKHYNTLSQLKVLIEDLRSKPWYTVSSVLALIGLGLTAVQTVYSV